MPVVRKFWIPALIVVVLALGGFVVYRLNGLFGSNNETVRAGAGLASDPAPFNPKRIEYQIYGSPGAVATINYLDLDARPQKVQNVALPWSLSLTTTDSSASTKIVAQGDGDTIGCRILVNGVVKDEKVTNQVNAQTFCTVKSA